MSDDSPATAHATPLTAETLAGLADCEVLPVPVPEWGGTAYLRDLPAGEGLELAEKVQALSKEEQPRACFLLLGATLCDPDGRPLFETLERAEEVLKRRSGRVLVHLQDVAMKHLGWIKDGGKGGFAPAGGDGSPTA